MQSVRDFLAVPRAMRQRQGAYLEMDGLPRGMATDLLGMGTWRLRSETGKSQGWQWGARGARGLPAAARIWEHVLGARLF